MEENIILPIEVGDYVEPVHTKFNDMPNEFSYEDLYGFVIDKNNGLITISSIGNNTISTFKEENFVKATVPELFKEKVKTRIKKKETF